MTTGEHPALAALHGLSSDLTGVQALVAGLGVSGFSAADALLERGARVRVVDDRPPADGSPAAERAHLLDVLGAELVLGDGPAGSAGEPEVLLHGVDLVVASPGWRPDHPVVRHAAGTGPTVWGEVELAWRLQGGDDGPPWLTVTGTNGKTTTVQLLEHVLLAAGLRARAAGNIGTTLVDVVRDPAGCDVVAVELSSFQLHLVRTVSPHASACLNLAPDHLDWHGGMAAYRAAKARVYERTRAAAVFNLADAATEQMVRDADVVEGCRAIGFGLDAPRVGEVGLVEDVLVDRAFIEERARAAAELAQLGDLVALAGVTSTAEVPPHLVANALAAAALARSLGVPAEAVRDGLRGASMPPHRAATVATVAGVRFVDDSKATNPHAADAALAAVTDVVWVAGGLAKGATYDELVARHAHRLRAAVLIGADRDLVADALRRHAPQIPVVAVDPPDTGRVGALDDAAAGAFMDRVVARAAGLAVPGSTVLLAPASASMDQFTSYVHRGEAFAAAVRRHAGTVGA